MSHALLREAYFKLSMPQYLRLRRITTQDFEALSIHANTLEIAGSTGRQYTITRHCDKLQCSCPDEPEDNILCKHLCWLLVMHGHANISSLLQQGDSLKLPVDTAWNSLHMHFNTDHAVEKECVICYFNVRTGIVCSKCCNLFHKSCLNRWLKQANTCPLCRATFNRCSPL